jgi:hypothetical protein
VTSTGVVYFSVRVRFSPAVIVLEGDWESSVIVNKVFVPHFAIPLREDVDNEKKRDAAIRVIKGIWD